MNKRLVARELIKVAKELLAANKPNDDPYQNSPRDKKIKVYDNGDEREFDVKKWVGNFRSGQTAYYDGEGTKMVYDEKSIKKLLKKEYESIYKENKDSYESREEFEEDQGTLEDFIEDNLYSTDGGIFKFKVK